MMVFMRLMREKEKFLIKKKLTGSSLEFERILDEGRLN
jgi:hypothetical protein